MTWLVTRQVVTPIRMARRVAERLAAGQLQERLRVRGEDDLARLATSFNQMATNLQRQIRQLEELSRVQRRFVSDVSHELRTPLTTVRMAGDVLHDARADFDPATARAAELLQTELDRFETLLADLLEISRFDAGAAVLELEDVNLVDVAHRVVDATRPLAEQRDVEVVVRGARTTPAWPRPTYAGSSGSCATWSPTRSTTPAPTADGDIVVLVAGDDQAAAIAVRDYGVGLAPGESAMVFNRFWRADPARARTSGGTGLGLSISLEDTHLHGGWLQAWGRPGEGAQFRLTLPRRAGAVLRHSPLPLVPDDVTEPVREHARRAALAAVRSWSRCAAGRLRVDARRRTGRRDPGPRQPTSATAASTSTRGRRRRATPAAEIVRGFLDAMKATPIQTNDGARVPARGRRRGLGPERRPSPTPATRGSRGDRGRRLGHADRRRPPRRPGAWQGTAADVAARPSASRWPSRTASGASTRRPTR